MNDYKFKARKSANIRKKFRIVSRGIRNIVSDKRKGVIVAALLLTWMLIMTIRSEIGMPPYTSMEMAVFMGLVLGAIAIFILLAYIVGRPRGAMEIERDFAAIGLQNDIGEVPELISIHEAEDSTELIMKFRNCGIPLSLWKDKQSAIETALGVVVINIRLMRGSRQVVVTCVRYRNAYANGRDYRPQKRTHLTVKIGTKAQGAEYLDFSKTAHAMIGGATGSGKTETLRNILVQCIEQGAETYIIDFKGGIDYTERIWRKATLITDYDALIKMLDEVDMLLVARENALRTDAQRSLEEALEKGCYNTNIPLTQVVIAFDEIAEALDKTGESKEIKEKIDIVIRNLSSIARLGRAVGIHLVLCTQRPDATVIPGQIRNNITYKLCGCADKVLSQIVLDNTLAAEIPVGCPGIFVNQDGDEVHCDRARIGGRQLTLGDCRTQGVATMKGWE